MSFSRTAGPPVRPLNRVDHRVENGHLFVGRVFASKVVDGKVTEPVELLLVDVEEAHMGGVIENTSTRTPFHRATK